jgi:hypothetical protein
MTHRIKTISNDIQGSVKAEPRNHAHNTSSSDSRQSNKILELEWEALGKKLNKQMDGTSGDELVSLQKQVRDKEEQLKYAERKIAELKRQLSALQEKQRGNNPGGSVHHKPAVPNKPAFQNKPAHVPGNKPAHTQGGNMQGTKSGQKNPPQRPMRAPQKFQGQGRK